MYLGKKKRFGGRLFALLAALLIVASTLFAVPAYAADGSTSGNPVADFFGGIAQTLGLAPANDAEPYAAGVTSDSDADSSTLRTWEGTFDNSTRDVGRIWTDKSVSNGNVTLSGGTENGITINLNEPNSDEDADFLVSLSALSSASNVSSSALKPLDIVLVLDQSGSMDDPIGTVGEYVETYNINRYGRYYIQNGDAYEQVTWSGGRNGHWEDQDGNRIEPIDSRWDDDPTHSSSSPIRKSPFRECRP